MADTLGPIQIHTTELPPGVVHALNEAFRQLVERIDAIVGLSAPDNFVNGVVTIATTQTITSQKTIKNKALRFTDADGNLVHAFGTKT